MKFISLVLIIFFSLAVMDSLSIYTVRYATDKTFTGGGHTITGDYKGTETKYNPATGFWESQTTNCPHSTATCYTRSNGVGYIEFTFYDLTGPLPLDSTAMNCYKDYINSNDSLVTVFIGPYVP